MRCHAARHADRGAVERNDRRARHSAKEFFSGLGYPQPPVPAQFNLEVDPSAIERQHERWTFPTFLGKRNRQWMLDQSFIPVTPSAQHSDVGCRIDKID